MTGRIKCKKRILAVTVALGRVNTINQSMNQYSKSDRDKGERLSTPWLALVFAIL